MKPLNLKIAGLQSFREEQEIPFDRLSQRGVFGIFGPTGSGKSTILDAVTLALFGKVVRAKNKTQGILNTSEKKLTISFLFELHVPGGKAKYRVDRRYSKKDEISVKHDHSRLVEIDQAGREVVLAEGESRVTAQVEDILGMKAEDFTRAVVLPQGKFAEFLLNLEGMKRKEMLQRLFSLERYGKLLSERLNRRVDRTRLDLTGVESELAGIGNASADILEEVEKRVGEAKTLEESAAAALKDARSRFEKAQKFRELQEELERVEEERAAHATREKEIRAVENAVDAGERSKKVVPLVKARDEAFTEKEAGLLAMKEAEALAAACRVEALAKKDLFDAARERREKEGPKLIVLKSALEAAQKLEIEVKGIEAEVWKSKKDRQIKLQEKDRSKEKAENDQRKITVLQGQVLREEENLTLHTVTASTREKVAGAKQGADRFLAAFKAQEAAAGEVKNRRMALTVATEDREKAEKALAGLEERVRVLRLREEEAVQPVNEDELAQKEIQLSGRKKDIGRLAEMDAAARAKKNFVIRLKTELLSLEGAVLEANDLVEKTAVLLSSLNKQYNRAFLQDRRILAAKLAENLAPGEPCPVCGSMDHPRPAPADARLAPEDGALEAIRGKIREAEEAAGAAQQRANEACTKFSGKKAELDVAEKDLKRFEDEILALGRALQVDRVQFQEDITKTVADLLEDAGKMEAMFNQERESLRIWREERQEAQRLLNKLLEDLSHKKSASAVAVQKIHAAERELEGALAAFEKAKTEREEAAAALEEVLNELGVEAGGGVRAVEEAVKRLKRMDQTAEASRIKLEQLRKEMELCAKMIEKARREESGANAAISGLDSRIAEKEKLLAAKRRELNGVTGGKPAGALLAETTRGIEKLKADEITARQAAERAESERAKAEEVLAKKKTILEEVTRRLEKYRNDLTDALQKQNFVTAKEAEDAYLSEEEIAEKKSILENYRDEGKRLSENRARILNIIGEERITGGQWLEAQSHLEEARTKKDKATKQLIELEKEFGDLGRKHTRWLELEKQRETLARETGLLETLKKLLKGDRFVQFLAHEQLEFVVRNATERLQRMTGGRYALLVDSESNFLIRDDANGSVKRPVTSLSGGETFQASLAMALSLSTQIQLRGRHPMEFFFLDEGFGSLDQNSLEVMVSTLEGLHMERMTIGVISHVGELQQRIGRKLLVEPAESNGKGSRVRLDFN